MNMIERRTFIAVEHQTIRSDQNFRL